jgi:hypothetical protein
MARRRKQTVDLASMFKTVANNLDEHRADLNQADSYNHNHGDNMVEIFNTISEAIEAQPGKRPATQLAHASKVLEKRSQSGSAKVYANGLAQASQQFKGQRGISPESLAPLLGSLLGGQAAGGVQAGASGDLLGSLLGGLAGGQGTAPQSSGAAGDLLGSLLGGLAGGQGTAPQSSGASGDLLGSLLGGLSGGGQAAGSQGASSQGAPSQGGLDLGDLLNAGAAFMGSQQQGDSAMQSIVKAFVAATQAGQSAHRAQSGELVVNSIVQELSKRSGR